VRSPDGSCGRASPRPVAAALALAALSLLAPWTLAFDPWAWAVWGRELTRGALDTAGGPSWKPLPVVAAAILAPTGAAAPGLWLVIARAGGLLALAGAHRVAGRLAGPAAAWTALAAMAVSEWWLFNTALGNSEGLLAAAALWAVAAHLAGRAGLALALGVVAALLRPEASPFLGLYALWLARADRVRRSRAALALLPVPLLWLGPDLLGTGGALGASDAARGPASPQSAVNADVPALEVLLDFADLLTLPVALAAVVGAVVGGRTARRLAVAMLAWVFIVAAMAQAGYAGNPRYNVAAAAVGCVLAGVGAARGGALAVGRTGLGRSPADGPAAGSSGGRAGLGGAPGASGAVASAAAGGSSGRDLATASSDAHRWAAPACGLAVAAAALALTGATLADQVAELGERARRRTDLGTLIARAGGAAAVKACAPARTAQPMTSLVAWRLDVPMAGLAAPPGVPTAVFRAPRGYAGEPVAPPPPPGGTRLAAAGDWTLSAVCGPSGTAR
jgi:hypothetical protein